MGDVCAILTGLIEVGKLVAGPIKSCYNELHSFEDNIKSLNEEADKLKVARDELLAATVNEEVEDWLKMASHVIKTIDKIKNKIPKVKKGCLNVISRYSLSKKAKETAEAVKKLHDCRPREQRDDKEFESRQRIEDRIVEVLRDRNVNTIGICGMGGIGKTTMAKRIMHNVVEKGENLFGKGSMVVVSQQVDIHAIQKQIAECLGLQLNVTNLSLRANEIHKGLTDHSKRVFIVLDDVWKALELQDLGFPCGTACNRFTVLLTSRDMNVLANMVKDQKNIFKLDVLNDTDAWSLFRVKIGSCAEIEDLHSVAKEVAGECKGLPLALVTVGKALKDKIDESLWDDALERLRSCHVMTDIPKELKDVYSQLRFSYDNLGEADMRAQLLFLLCSIFTEDYDIPLEILTWYAMGINMLEGTRNLKQARDRTRSLVDLLKDRCLLLEGVDKDSVKMHDVLRDMAIHIASEEHHGFVMNLDGMSMDGANWEKYSHKDWSWISMILGNKPEFPMELEFPEELQLSRLRLLMLDGRGDYDDHVEESRAGLMRLLDQLFDRMKGMMVLSLECTSIKSLPPRTTQFLKNLKTLRLFKCRMLETISVVGELSTLKILSCIDCGRITALPAELNGRLKLLRLLEIINCESLQTIAPGVMSSLVLLEELRIKNSFDGWEAKEGSNSKNAALVELESLTNLTCLEIKISNPNLVAEEVRLSPNIVKYDIKSYPFTVPSQDVQVTKSMTLYIREEINVGNWIQDLIRKTEYLELHGDGANKVNLMKLENIKHLTIRECSTVKKLMDTTSIPIESNNSFSLCHHFPTSTARNIFSQLENLTVLECKEMEVIFCNHDDDDDGKMQKDGESHDHLIPNLVFHKLKKLDLRYLPKLITLYKGVQRIEFPKLTEMVIFDMPKLTSLVGSLESHKVVAPLLGRLQLNELDQDNYLSSVLCYQLPTSFISNLEELDIGNLNNIIYLMSSSIAKNLVHLRELHIHDCKEMLQVIKDDEEQVVASEVVPSLFPCLETLHLISLPKLRSFCQWKQDFVGLPSLKYFGFFDCPQMEIFIKGSLWTPKLRRIYNNWQEVKLTGVNEAIQQCFINRKGSTSAEPAEGKGQREGAGEIEEIRE